ncbi:MAG: ATP-binding cassette domain-containing protein [Myxococcales bacterium]|nr:ATP-binding cassette domain-containing protein [Myxococcales bacterium]MCB9530492.1 ATP-binding cassette domain-containing protein [Myxococcales bacterium]MCB9533444.1 ATP-binding cassette domain-containing protein [Myxococcales bacterium]
MIEFIDIYKAFGPKEVLKGVNLEVQKGEIMFIIGQSGAGKSVLVKHLVGLLRPDKGRVILDGEDITDLSERAFYRIRKKCSYVFQNSTLFDSMTLLDNVALPIRKHQHVTQRRARELAMEKLALVGMQGEASRYPADFGDGMRKKVAIARALTLNPEFVIFDEPTTGIDPISANIVDRLITDLSERLGVTSIVVSHDLRSIFGVADRVAMLYKGQFVLDGPPSAYRTTDDPIVQQFINGRPEGPMEV